MKSTWMVFVVLAAVGIGCTAGGPSSGPRVPSDPGGGDPGGGDPGGGDPGGGDPGGGDPVEGTGVYEGGAEGTAGGAALCPASSVRAAGCVSETNEGAAGLCNELDDDCDGDVDEDCFCDPGAVQRCFAGPPGRRGAGACSDGMQTCIAMGEFGGVWGPCEGGISPSPEACDDLDNDCNGCSDEIEGCVPDGSCPAPGDPRIPTATPFSSVTLRGDDFYDGGDATSWRWTVVGSPCDRMFQSIPGSTATSENGQLSFTLTGAGTATPSIQFTLSGDYRVTLTVTRADGSEFTCTFIVPVRAPGLRVELCWDATGPTADAFGGNVDVDLHLAKMGMTGAWFDDNDCHYMNCKASSFSDTRPATTWGYADTPIANCTGPGSRGDFEGSCPNPRLDIDNVFESDGYVPENINLDNPNDGDHFRVMVHHYTSTTRETHPLVNVYCGGELRGTYGAAPDVVTGFAEGGGREMGDMWRVVDVTTTVAGGEVGCDLSPIHPPGAMGGYHVTTSDVSL